MGQAIQRISDVVTTAINKTGLPGAHALSGGINLGTDILTSLSPKKTPSPEVVLPTITPPPVMPLADSEAVAAAKKKSLQDQIGRRGRVSTILTDNSDRLGG